MKSLLKNSFLFIILVSVTLGCRKAPPVTESIAVLPTDSVDTGCDDFPMSPEIGWSYIKTGDQYYSPYFNPNDANEFIYLKKGESSPYKALYKYNMTTQSEELLCDDEIIMSPPKWGKTGWITFTNLNRKVWKIREVGTELAQLTFDIKDIDPHFDDMGHSICYYRSRTYHNAELEANPDLRYEYKMMFIDLNGEFTDSILVDHIIPGNYYQKWTVADFDVSDIYFYGGGDDFHGIYVLDQALESISPIHTWSDSHISRQTVSSMDYSDGFVYYTRYLNTLSKVDVLIGEETLIKDACDTRNYNYVSVSPDGQKLLVEKVISKVLNEYEIDEQHEIWLMDVDGSNEVKILGE